MPGRRLGSSGPVVSAIGLGCIGMTGGFYGAPDPTVSLRALHRALDLGCTLLDTSDAYGPYTNEELLGRLLAQRREEIVVATKFGIRMDPVTMRRTVDGRPATVYASCEASLRRLGVDRIDVYFPHRVDPSVPIEETVGAMADLVRQGKVAHLGLCEASPETIRRAHAVHPIAAVQQEYSLWSRDVEDTVLPTLQELGIGLVAYAPLGRGFLPGSHTDPSCLDPSDVRRNLPRFAPEHRANNLALVEAIRVLSAENGITPAQLALAWLLHQDPGIVPIPGTTDPQHLADNVAAARITLDEDTLEHISNVVPEASGERYDPAGMKSVGI
ncbi:aldo/keto reductase [Arthrobacter sp. MMS18-M83]|uniref:aldo/keto reductase n=1 Tax=Arthrobacter sp. MMS18-M83 TaxID=2996261 RepID=UPI003FA3CC4E